MATAIRANLGMALLTELGALLIKQEAMDRSVGAVAQAAIFGNWIVFPEKWSPLFGMAIVAIVIQAQLLQHERAKRTMRGMTVTADYLALTDTV